MYQLPLGHLTSDEQVAVAIAPFAIALLLRVLLGQTQFTPWIVMLSTMWFAMNVLVAPYSSGIRQAVIALGDRFR
ncbi:MAG: hypothetical protein ACJ8EK_13540 [Bradyrhizobium sp.]